MAVVTKAKPSEEDLQKILLPWHEREYTGLDDFCVWVDKTEEAERDYANPEYKKYSDGKTLVEFANDWNGLKPIPDKSGRLGRFTNPNRKWDYWTIGGRYEGRLRKLHSSGKFDSLPVGQFDLPAMKQQRIADWAGAKPDAPAFSCWGFVMDGKWYEKGAMGWWGMSTNNADENEWQMRVDKLIETLDRHDWITMVDCHI